MNEKIDELYNKDYLTQKDIIQLLLHNAQHMVTRDELKSDNAELKQTLREDINKLDTKIDNVKDELNTKIDNVRNELKEDINKISNKFDRLQWFIVTSIILFKEKLIALIEKIFS